MSIIPSIEEGRKEDGNRSIADKIISRFRELDKTIESNQGRWAWELLQNAKDSIAEFDDRTVSITILLDEDKVEFRHNGGYFTEKDIRGLINQISSKEVEEGIKSKKTGRFGTGFLTTHLLSRIVKIKGVLKANDNSFYEFGFLLDRDGKATSQLAPKIDKCWAEFDSSVKLTSNYNNNIFNTSFCYPLLSDIQKNVAKIGIEEFEKLIPLVLIFNKKILSVEIQNSTSLTSICYQNNPNNTIEDNIDRITKIENGKKTEILFFVLEDGSVSVASEIIKFGEGYSFVPNNDKPKLFCDFPLIGSEDFNFPVIVNSFCFNPITERNGVWLKQQGDFEVLENKNLIERAVELYKSLVIKTTSNSFYDYYNIVNVKLPKNAEREVDESWYREKIQKPLKEFIFNAEIVELETEESKKALSKLWFPPKSYTNEVKEKLWEFTFEYNPLAVCKKNHLIQWSNLSWEGWSELTYDAITASISSRENICALADRIKLDIEASFKWINSYHYFLLKDEKNEILFSKFALIPNKNGVFKKRHEVFLDKIEDEALLNVLKFLGEDWREILLNEKIDYEDHPSKNLRDIALRITEKFNQLRTKGYGANYDEDTVQAIIILSEWFENNRDKGKDLFPELYKKKADLFLNTINDKDSLYKLMRTKTDLSQITRIAQAIENTPNILDNLKKAEDLSKLLEEFKVDDVSQLKVMLLAHGVSTPKQKLEITDNVLVSLGVSSVEELEDALKDIDLAGMFSHHSTPNVQSFLYAQNLIARARQNIIQHIKKLPEYDCSDLEEIANTVIAGVNKNGVPVNIVVRPSDNGEVIIYYSSEKDVLDYENAELWIDNGREEPRHLTLGKILKTTGIKKIPV